MGVFAKSFRDLDVYQESLAIALEIHAFAKGLPTEERYALADQMRRASRSVAANISESWRKRRYKAAFVAKLSDSETEASEMQCWLDFSLKAGYMTKEMYQTFDLRYEKIISQIVLMIDGAEKWCR
ncbi:four helix bundle protein [Pontiellaceae bacterium B12227]|nr:four helix bundle protein [Pontiellaceae bacterium B12227]